MPETRRRWGRTRADVAPADGATPEQLGVSAETLAHIREVFGLAEDASTDQMFAAIEERQIQVAAARRVDVPPPRGGARPALLLDWAEATGRIAAAARPQWEATYAASPQTTDALVRVLATEQRPLQMPAPAVAASRAETSVVAGAAVATATRHQSATGLDVSVLPSRMRAAAARMNDATLVVELIQEFGGKTNAEVTPTWLHMCGYQAVAAEVARDDADAYQAAATAYMNGTGPNPEGLPDLYAE